MAHTRVYAVALLATCAMPSLNAWAASAADDLAQVTGTNVGFISSELTRYQKAVNEAAAKRIELIASVERLAAEARLEADREVMVLKTTGGTELLKVYDALREQSEKTGAAPALLDAVQAQARKDASSVHTPLAVSTGKLDEAAKTLARLSKSRSSSEDAHFLLSYLKETRAEVDKLRQESKKKEESADKAQDDKAAKVEKPKKPE